MQFPESSTLEKSYFTHVPDQVRTLSQVGTKRISKGGWTILELSEPCRNRYFGLVLKNIKNVRDRKILLTDFFNVQYIISQALLSRKLVKKNLQSQKKK